MNRCPISYKECESLKYSLEGLHLLSKNLNKPLIFPYTAQEQLKLAAKYATKLSIQGIQPKLSVRLNVPQHRFEIVETKGTFILKPQSPYYQELPQNEDLTMRLAAMSGIDTPLHGMVYCEDGSLSYFIKRFDRFGHGKKLAVEDFAQLSEASRETKYESSMEKLVFILERYCSFPVLEKIKLFRRTIFCFLVGNEDMHLKNFSLIRLPGKVELTPAYDLVNSAIVLHSEEELALPLAGKKKNLKREHFVDYYGQQRMNLRRDVLETEMGRFEKIIPEWKTFVQTSFLSQGMKVAYTRLIENRAKRLF